MDTYHYGLLARVLPTNQLVSLMILNTGISWSLCCLYQRGFTFFIYLV